MLDPLIVESPTMFPGFCRCCGSATGPMVDTHVQLGPFGRVYVCVQNCLGPMAVLAGYTDRATVDRLEAELAAAAERETGLRAQIAASARKKTIRVDELEAAGIIARAD